MGGTTHHMVMTEKSIHALVEHRCGNWIDFWALTPLNLDPSSYQDNQVALEIRFEQETTLHWIACLWSGAPKMCSEVLCWRCVILSRPWAMMIELMMIELMMIELMMQTSDDESDDGDTLSWSLRAWRYLVRYVSLPQLLCCLRTSIW